MVNPFKNPFDKRKEIISNGKLTGYDTGTQSVIATPTEKKIYNLFSGGGGSSDKQQSIVSQEELQKRQQELSTQAKLKQLTQDLAIKKQQQQVAQEQARIKALQQKLARENAQKRIQNLKDVSTGAKLQREILINNRTKERIVTTKNLDTGETSTRTFNRGGQTGGISGYDNKILESQEQKRIDKLVSEQQEKVGEPEIKKRWYNKINNYLNSKLVKSENSKTQLKYNDLTKQRDKIYEDINKLSSKYSGTLTEEQYKEYEKELIPLLAQYKNYSQTKDIVLKKYPDKKIAATLEYDPSIGQNVLTTSVKDQSLTNQINRAVEKATQSIQRGGGLKDTAVLSGLVAAQTGASAVKGFTQLPSAIKDVIKNPKLLTKIPSAVAKSGKEFGMLFKISPTAAFVKIGTEIYVIKGTNKVLSKLGKLSSKTFVRLNPKFLGKIKKGKPLISEKSLINSKKKFIIDKPKKINKTPLKTTFPKEFKLVINNKEINSYLIKQLEKRGIRYSKLSPIEKNILNQQIKVKLMQKPELYIPKERLLFLKRQKIKNIRNTLLKSLDSKNIPSPVIFKKVGKKIIINKKQTDFLRKFSERIKKLNPKQKKEFVKNLKKIFKEYKSPLTKTQKIALKRAKKVTELENIRNTILKGLKNKKQLSIKQKNKIVEELKNKIKYEPEKFIPKINRIALKRARTKEYFKDIQKRRETALKSLEKPSGKQQLIQIQKLEPEIKQIQKIYEILPNKLTKTQKIALKKFKKITNKEIKISQELKNINKQKINLKNKEIKIQNQLQKTKQKVKQKQTQKLGIKKNQLQKTKQKVKQKQTQKLGIKKNQLQKTKQKYKQLTLYASVLLSKQKQNYKQGLKLNQSLPQGLNFKILSKQISKLTPNLKFLLNQKQPELLKNKQLLKQVQIKRKKSVRFQEINKTRTKKQSKPILTFNVYGKSGRKFVKLNTKPLRKIDALSKGAYAIDNTTSKQFKIVPAGKKKEIGKLRFNERNYFNRAGYKLREYRIKKGRKFVINPKYIEKTKYGIDTRGEKKGLTIARYLKQRTGVRRSAKRKITPTQRRVLLKNLKKARSIRFRNLRG